MDGLLGYGSDSESGSDSEDGSLACISNRSHTKLECPPEHDAKSILLAEDCDIGENTFQLEQHEKDCAWIPTCTSSTTDFFGLGSIPVLSLTLGHPSLSQQQHEMKSRKVITNHGEIEVPAGEFWDDFTPDISDAGVNKTSHQHYYEKQTTQSEIAQVNTSQTRSSSHLTLTKGFKQKRAHSFQSGVDDGDGKKCICAFSFGKDLNSKYIQDTQTSPGVTSEMQTCCSSQLTAGQRNIYYVHSKVLPFLSIEMPSNKCSRSLASSWAAHGSVVNRIAWNVPNYSHLLLSAGMDAEVRIWNVWSSLDRFVVNLVGHNKAVRHAEWCRDGRAVFSCSYDRTALVTDVETGKVLTLCEHAGYVTAGCGHPCNSNMFLTGMDNMIFLWDQRTPQAPVKLFSYKDKFGQVQDLLYVQDGQEIISCSDHVSRDSADRGVMAWDFRSGVVLSNQIFQERYSCTRLKLHPNKQQFLAQTQGGYVAIFSTKRPYKMDKGKRFEGHKLQGYAAGLDVSPDGSLVYSCSAEGGLHCYDHRSGRLLRKLSSRDVIMDVSCHPVLPSIIAVCSWAGSVSLWQ